MTELHSLDLPKMKEKIEEIGIHGEIDGLPLGLFAEDLETIEYIRNNLGDFDPAEEKCRGNVSMLEWASREMNFGIVHFLLRFDQTIARRKAGIVAALESSVKLRRYPYTIVDMLFEPKTMQEEVEDIISDVLPKLAYEAIDLFQTVSRSHQQALADTLEGFKHVSALFDKNRELKDLPLLKSAVQNHHAGVAAKWNSAGQYERNAALKTSVRFGYTDILEYVLNAGEKILSEDHEELARATVFNGPVLRGFYFPCHPGLIKISSFS